MGGAESINDRMLRGCMGLRQPQGHGVYYGDSYNTVDWKNRLFASDYTMTRDEVIESENDLLLTTIVVRRMTIPKMSFQKSVENKIVFVEPKAGGRLIVETGHYNGIEYSINGKVIDKGTHYLLTLKEENKNSPIKNERRVK